MTTPLQDIIAMRDRHGALRSTTNITMREFNELIAKIEGLKMEYEQQDHQLRARFENVISYPVDPATRLHEESGERVWDVPGGSMAVEVSARGNVKFLTTGGQIVDREVYGGWAVEIGVVAIFVEATTVSGMWFYR